MEKELMRKIWFDAWTRLDTQETQDYSSELCQQFADMMGLGAVKNGLVYSGGTLLVRTEKGGFGIVSVFRRTFSFFVIERDEAVEMSDSEREERFYDFQNLSGTHWPEMGRGWKCNF